MPIGTWMCIAVILEALLLNRDSWRVPFSFRWG